MMSEGGTAGFHETNGLGTGGYLGKVVRGVDGHFWVYGRVEHKVGVIGWSV